MNGTTSLRALLTSERLFTSKIGTERDEVTVLVKFVNLESGVAPIILTELLVIVVIDTSVLISILINKLLSMMAVDLLNCYIPSSLN